MAQNMGCAISATMKGFKFTESLHISHHMWEIWRLWRYVLMEMSWDENTHCFFFFCFFLSSRLYWRLSCLTIAEYLCVLMIQLLSLPSSLITFFKRKWEKAISTSSSKRCKCMKMHRYKQQTSSSTSAPDPSALSSDMFMKFNNPRHDKTNMKKVEICNLQSVERWTDCPGFRFFSPLWISP